MLATICRRYDVRSLMTFFQRDLGIFLFLNCALMSVASLLAAVMSAQSTSRFWDERDSNFRNFRYSGDFWAPTFEFRESAGEPDVFGSFTRRPDSIFTTVVLDGSDFPHFSSKQPALSALYCHHEKNNTSYLATFSQLFYHPPYQINAMWQHLWPNFHDAFFSEIFLSEVNFCCIGGFCSNVCVVLNMRVKLNATHHYIQRIGMPTSEHKEKDCSTLG